MSEFDDVIMAVDSSKVAEPVTVKKDDAREEKPKEDRVGAEKAAYSGKVMMKDSTVKEDGSTPQLISKEKEPESKQKEKTADSGNVTAQEVVSTAKEDGGMSQLIAKEKEPESKQKDEISCTEVTEKPKEKLADKSKATVSPGTTEKPVGAKEGEHRDKKVESPVASGKNPSKKEVGNKDVKKTSPRVIEKNAEDKEMGNKGKLPEKTSKTSDGKEVVRNSKDVKPSGVKGGKQPGQKSDAGDKGKTVKASSTETTRGASGKAVPAIATSKKDVTKSAAAADAAVLDPIAKVTMDDANTTSSIEVPDSKVTDVEEEVIPKSKDRNVEKEGLVGPVSEVTPSLTIDLEAAGVIQTPKILSKELVKDVADDEGQVKGHEKEEGVKRMPELLSKELTEDVAAASAGTDELCRVEGHEKEKLDEKDCDKSKDTKSETVSNCNIVF